MLPYLNTEDEEENISISDEEHDKLDQLPLAPISQCPLGSKVKKLPLTHEPKKIISYFIGSYNFL